MITYASLYVLFKHRATEYPLGVSLSTLRPFDLCIPFQCTHAVLLNPWNANLHLDIWLHFSGNKLIWSCFVFVKRISLFMISRRHLVSWTYCKKLYCSKGFILDQLKGKHCVKELTVRRQIALCCFYKCFCFHACVGWGLCGSTIYKSCYISGKGHTCSNPSHKLCSGEN